MDDIFEGFLSSLRNKKEKKAKDRGLSVEFTDFESFQISINKFPSGIQEVKLGLKDAVELMDFIKSNLRVRAQIIQFFTAYHPDSKTYWLRNIDKKVDDDEEVPPYYELAIDLEDFMERVLTPRQQMMLSVDFYIPDNYGLAEKALKDFKKKFPKYAKTKFEEASFREIAVWRCKSLAPIKALAKYLSTTYVEPKVKAEMEAYKIKDIKFTKTKIDFKYK